MNSIEWTGDLNALKEAYNVYVTASGISADLWTGTDEDNNLLIGFGADQIAVSLGGRFAYVNGKWVSVA